MPTEFSHGEEEDVLGATSGVDVLLAQAESLARLRRADDVKRKVLVAAQIAADCVTAFPDSALARLTAARVFRLGGQLDSASKLLSLARSRRGDETTTHNIAYEENLLAREREVAGGTLVAMAQHLLVYACQNCGRLVEYILLPCMFCGWHPTTLLEMSHSGQLSTNVFSLWELLEIGRGMRRGRKAVEVVPDLAEVAAKHMADSQSEYRRDIETVFQIAQKKKFDDYFCYLEVSNCRSCGTPNYREDAKHCSKCKTPLRLPPPLRLLNCLTRLSMHFQYNFEGPKSTEFNLFIRYLVSLQSKLYRTQDTPSDRDRALVLKSISELARFDVVNGLGVIVMTDPQNITYRLHEGLSAEKAASGQVGLADFRNTLQFLADWMSRGKALS